MARTRRVDCNDPGIRRIRRGRGFSYHEHTGERITDPGVIERISALAIPPAWTDVWICEDPRGHIQATGFDSAGRKQYRYHDDWRVHRDRQKFDEMLSFARKLPRLREQAEQTVVLRGLGEERICACAALLLDLGLFRIGSERYEEDHGTYGLTTLKIRHVVFEDSAAVFDYRGKLGQRSRHRIHHEGVRAALRSLIRRKGAGPRANLFGFRQGRDWRPLGPEHVNSWIQATLGPGYSAKDFRTWNATVLAAAVLAQHGAESSAGSRRQATKLAVAEAARLLNNTPAVARGSYIDPRVFDRFNSGETIAPALARLERKAGKTEFVDREAIERAVLRLLD